ncbi:MAG: Oligopeptide transport ATP-binding protein OppF [Smithella sp. PtaU1.Bin162]|nr:MAG: Oligopeptide transport ATP-binding protein OppF [Smithella sp. PtaU1.Bin162]
MPETLIDLQNLNKIFTFTSGIFNSQNRIVHAVQSINLQIWKGETLGLVGESGCGKSTLARLIVGLENPSSGFIFFQGDDISSYDKRAMKIYRRNVQLIFQDPYSSLNPRKSAISMVKEPLIIHRSGNSDERRRQATELMEKVGLSAEQANRYPHEFSGGQRQRIGIARALILQPQLIIADEPVSALDVSVQAQILNLLKDLKQDFGLTYLFISHDLNVIRHMADRVAVMYLGQIVELAENRDIYESPLHPYTQLLLSAVPDCNPRKKRKKVIIKDEIGHGGNRGCNFQDRCPYKLPLCKEQQPVLQEVNKQRFCACHLAGSIRMS